MQGCLCYPDFKVRQLVPVPPSQPADASTLQRFSAQYSLIVALKCRSLVYERWNSILFAQRCFRVVDRGMKATMVGRLLAQVVALFCLESSLLKIMGILPFIFLMAQNLRGADLQRLGLVSILDPCGPARAPGLIRTWLCVCALP